MIQVDNLTKRYGPVTAIHDVSFNVDKGQIVGFLGPNGAGKSTTMKILSCFMPASGGTRAGGGLRRLLASRSRCAGASATCPENAPLYARPAGRAPISTSWPRSRAWRAARAAGRVADVMERCFIADMQQPADRQAVEGLPAAGRAGPGAPRRSGGADPRRAHHRARPAADRGDPRADPVAGRPAHGDPVDAHPPRGLDGVRRRHHHQPRAHRGPGHRVASWWSRSSRPRASSCEVAGAGGRVAAALRGDPGRARRAAARVPRRRRRAFWWSRRATATCGASWSASSTGRGWALLELHQVGHEPRGGLHPRGRGRGAGRRHEPVPARGARRRA